jgi:hypothetical protein
MSYFHKENRILFPGEHFRLCRRIPGFDLSGSPLLSALGLSTKANLNKLVGNT